METSQQKLQIIFSRSVSISKQTKSYQYNIEFINDKSAKEADKIWVKNHKFIDTKAIDGIDSSISVVAKRYLKMCGPIFKNETFCSAHRIVTP